MAFGGVNTVKHNMCATVSKERTATSMHHQPPALRDDFNTLDVTGGRVFDSKESMPFNGNSTITSRSPNSAE